MVSDNELPDVGRTEKAKKNHTSKGYISLNAPYNFVQHSL